ncbi:hypothetical protein R3P38DRAFT_3247816 [Favolaschia claudopus]|uniref:Uncharacterized protein n=1 Tax=Favolaschia claudopus TaxID=2862362 RepID=A0AAV9YYM6_9AGAR
MPQETKKKTRKGKDDAPQKRGNPGDFRGSRLEFLRSKVPEFCKHSDARTTRDFWKTLWAEYWALYPWEVPINQEPPDDLEGLGKADSVLTAEELASKNEIKDKAQTKIKRWFSYARHSGKGGGNPFAKWLAQLRRVDERAPKRLALHQVYMQDEEKNDEINRLLKERHPELVGRQNSIKERTAIARELLEAEDPEIREEYRLRGEEEYQEALEEFKSGEGADAEAEEDAEARQEARTRLAVTIQPLLDSIRAITGCQVLLIAGTVVEGRFDVRTLHGHAREEDGLDKGLDFTAWDTTGFKGVMDQWMRYLIAAAAEPKATGPTKPVDRGSNADPPPPAADDVAEAAPSDVVVVDKDPQAPANDETPAPNDGAGGPTNGEEENGGGAGPMEVEEVVVAPELDRMAGVGSPLKRTVRAMTPDSRGARVFELQHMNEFYRNRENNKAMAMEKLDQLGIRGEVQGLMAELRAANKRGAGDEEVGGGSRVTKRAKTKASPNDDDDYGSDDDDDDEEDRSATPKPAEPPRPRPRRIVRGLVEPTADKPDADANAPVPDVNTTPVPDADAIAPVTDASTNASANVPVTDEGVDAPADASPAVVVVPKWAPHSRKLLETGEGGEAWNKVVEGWWKREEKAAFKGPKTGAAAKDRPGEIKGWIARARTGGPQPPIKDLFTFSGTWWNWWMKLNPGWRAKAYDGRRLLKEGEGEWKVLQSQTGPNGLLNALICLRWWRDVLGENAGQREQKEWAEAVEEVNWVLNEIS